MVLISRKYWDSKKDSVMAVGSYSSMEDRNNPDIREVNGIKYTMLNYTYGTNGIDVPSGKDYLVNQWNRFTNWFAAGKQNLYQSVLSGNFNPFRIRF